MAASPQRYISKELTHFVGRGQELERQYELLVKILREGWLTHPPHNPNISGNLYVIESAKISQNEMYSPEMVCFCDIPVEDLALHVRKYSCFGLSFDKDFIVQKGGAPVYYLPTEAGVDIQFQPIRKWQYFDKMIQEYHRLFRLFDQLIMKDRTAPGVPQDFLDLMELKRFIDFQVFSYLKFFDHRYPDDHPDNYYFEREWRVVGNVQFNIEDVIRVFIPEECAKRLRQDCPEYYGQLTFLK